jgi:hypothetical protein
VGSTPSRYSNRAYHALGIFKEESWNFCLDELQCTKFVLSLPYYEGQSGLDKLLNVAAFGSAGQGFSVLSKTVDPGLDASWPPNQPRPPKAANYDWQLFLTINEHLSSLLTSHPYLKSWNGDEISKSPVRLG